MRLWVRRVRLAIPRNRSNTLAPQPVIEHARRRPGFDEHVLSLHPRATMTEFQEHLADLYHVAIAPECISAVTDEMLGAVTILQQRSPESPTILGQVSASHYDQGSMASLWHVQSPCAASTL